jgi:hypothetical protein
LTSSIFLPTYSSALTSAAPEMIAVPLIVMENRDVHRLLQRLSM